MPDLVGQTVGQTLANRYHLLAKLDEGAWPQSIGPRIGCAVGLVAVKIMKAHQFGDAVALERFRFLRYVPCVPMAAARST